jgi:hypothetical protein
LKTKLIILNIVLVAAVGAIVWQARNSWKQAQTARQNNLHVQVKPLPPPALTPAPKPAAESPANFADVATKDLFSKDRNPNIVIEPPKVEPPKPMPPLPVVYGVLGLPSGTKALMAEKAGAPSRPVHEGDKIGEFLIASLDPRTVVFDWDGKKIQKNIDDLIDRSGPPAAVGAGPAVSIPAGNAAPAPPPKPPDGKPYGKDTGGFRACVPGDTSPAGAIADGFRKTVSKSPFGESCTWVPVQ